MTNLESKFTEQRVLSVERHSPKHLTFTITRPTSYRFSAGQFSRLGFRQNNGFIWRAYSIISAEYAEVLEYFVILIDQGEMSAHFAQLKTGDTLLLDNNATGFFLPERFPDGKDLIMLATGSGIAPFLSMLQQPEIWQRFDTLALVHSVSHQRDLIFNQQIAQLPQHPLVGEYGEKLRFVPITTREANGDFLHQRLPQTLKNGTLAQALKLDFTPADSRFMICGNPQMVQDVFKTLLEMGFTMHRNKTAGQIMMENGF